MLTSGLIRVRIQGKEIQPSLVDVSSEKALERAGSICRVFDEAKQQRWSRGEIESAARAVEGNERDHKFVRGLTKLMLDGCSFEVEAPIPPDELRAAAFIRAAETGPLARRAGPAGRRTAEDVLRDVVSEREQTSSGSADPRSWLYADLKSEQVLSEFRGPSDERALLERYNVALVQAILLKSESLTLHLDAPDPKRIRQLFRYLKFFQLMYRSGWNDGTLTLHVDGPQSLLGASTRYGMQLATFLPAVLLQPGAWALEAEVRWGRRRLRKRFVIDDSAGLVSHYRDTGAWMSRAERWFRERWEQADTHGWTLSSGRLIELGEQRVLVPDLMFEKDGRVAFVDIVGYWRGRWLKQHLSGTPAHVIVAASRRLVGDKKGGVPKALAGRCVPFAEVIPVSAVLEIVERVAVTESEAAFRR